MQHDPAKQFYNTLAAEYDAMTDFTARLEAATAFARAVAPGRQPASVLDVATGTGVYALALAKAGATTVTGTDLAPAMLAQARQRANAHHLEIDWLAADMTQLDQVLSSRFELVLCMGNSLPHLLNAPDLARTMQAFVHLCEAGGIVVVQVLNYANILAAQQRIVEITRIQDLEFIRFYDFTAPQLTFNILTINWSADEPQHQLQSVPLYPWRCDELQKAMQAAGLDQIRAYGSPELEPFDAATSPTLLLAGKA